VSIRRKGGAIGEILARTKSVSTSVGMGSELCGWVSKRSLVKLMGDHEFIYTKEEANIAPRKTEKVERVEQTNPYSHFSGEGLSLQKDFVNR